MIPAIITSGISSNKFIRTSFVTILISDMTIVVCILAALILIILPTLIFLIIGYNSYPAIKDLLLILK